MAAVPRDMMVPLIIALVYGGSSGQSRRFQASGRMKAVFCLRRATKRIDDKRIDETGYAVDATYTTSCAPPPMMEDLGLGSVAIARPASL